MIVDEEDVVDAHGGMTGIENLKLMVLITAIEDKVALMSPLQSVGGARGGLDIAPPGIFSSVLHHNGLDLIVRIGDAPFTEV